MYTDESLIAFCQRALQTPSVSGHEHSELVMKACRGFESILLELTK